MQLQKIHYNKPQLSVFATLARITIAIFGRGTGKTEGITALWVLYNMLAMARSVGGIIVPKYDGVEKIWAGIRKGFEKFGYFENEHYVINVQPPQEWGELKGYNAPSKNFKNYVSFYNGSGFYILSANSNHNGSNMDWLVVEECKLIPQDFFRETYLAVRGNEDLFGSFSHYGSLLCVTDRPRDTEEQWIYQFETEYHTPKNRITIDVINAIHLQINKLVEQYELIESELVELRKKPLVNKNAIAKKTAIQDAIAKEIASYKSQQNELRKYALNLVEASTLENIEVLGINKILEFRKNLTPYDFAVSVLNMRPNKAEHGFYHSFSPQKHAYYSDTDVLENQALHIGCDYNAAICCMEIVQHYANQFKVVRSLDSTQGIEGLCKAFAVLFEKRANKLVYFHYDHTAQQGKGASASSERYYIIVIRELRSYGFNVIEKDMGYASSHEERYSFYEKLFHSKDSKQTVFTYNAKYCQNLALSLSNARAKYVSGADKKTHVGKDKDDEKNMRLDQTQTTHHSEALDTLVTGLLIKTQKTSTFQLV